MKNTREIHLNFSPYEVAIPLLLSSNLCPLCSASNSRKLILSCTFRCPFKLPISGLMLLNFQAPISPTVPSIIFFLVLFSGDFYKKILSRSANLRPS